ncbi:MAG: PAS domain-containing protein [Sphingomicrobium sp.]|jgi:PAS domain S-box-containing protein
MLAQENPEQLLDTALNALSAAPEWRSIVDELPAPIYITDAKGRVTYWNRACIAFAGREPQLGRDKWCVTWQLYTTAGDPLRHADCPMAQAIKQQRPIRDAVAIAERPDGSRVAFRAYPTPLFDDDGSLKGAINLLLDVSSEQSKALRAQAEHCRRLAEATFDGTTSRVLGDMAEGFNRTADQLSSN